MVAAVESVDIVAVGAARVSGGGYGMEVARSTYIDG